MSSFPPAIEAALVRVMGAYLRDTPKTELPAGLRPLAGKHQKMVSARKNDLLAAFDGDAALRALIVQWLDDSPNLPRSDADIMRIAAARDDGWEHELAQRARRGAAAPASDKGDAAILEREKDRARKAKEDARKARDETRKAKDDAQRAIADASRRVRELETELTAVRARLAQVENELAAARSEAAATTAELERERRKARRRVQEAEQDAKHARKAAQRASAENERVKAKLSQARPKKQSARAGPAVAEPPARRKRLAVPKGRLEDDPETLQAWLETPQVHLLVDGYNVSKAKGGFGDLTLERQRARLIESVGSVARRYGIAATIVFDGSVVPPGTTRRPRGPVAVEYSSPDEIADDHLIAKLEKLPAFPVVVATNDRELQHRAKALGATVATSDQLLALLR